jgi:flagellar biosynthesis/type III secretory pathway M-ring protein FliF/YscJ
MSELEKQLNDLSNEVKNNSDEIKKINALVKKSVEKNSNRKTNYISLNTELAVLFIILTISIILIIFSMTINLNSIFGFSLLVILGLIMFVVSLTLASVILHRMHLSSRSEALGLPSGSIRALIALSLIIIFAIMALYLYGNLAPQQIALNSNVTVVYPNGTQITTLNSTSIMSEPSEAQKTFSLQTLTTVSTLVVAIASFYFGTKAAATKTATSNEETPDDEDQPDQTTNTPKKKTSTRKKTQAEPNPKVAK